MALAKPVGTGRDSAQRLKASASTFFSPAMCEQASETARAQAHMAEHCTNKARGCLLVYSRLMTASAPTLSLSAGSLTRRRPALMVRSSKTRRNPWQESQGRDVQTGIVYDWNAQSAECWSEALEKTKALFRSKTQPASHATCIAFPICCALEWQNRWQRPRGARAKSVCTKEESEASPDWALTTCVGMRSLQPEARFCEHDFPAGHPR